MDRSALTNKHVRHLQSIGLSGSQHWSDEARRLRELLTLSEDACARLRQFDGSPLSTDQLMSALRSVVATAGRTRMRRYGINPRRASKFRLRDGTLNTSALLNYARISCEKTQLGVRTDVSDFVQRAIARWLDSTDRRNAVDLTMGEVPHDVDIRAMAEFVKRNPNLLDKPPEVWYIHFCQSYGNVQKLCTSTTNSLTDQSRLQRTDDILDIERLLPVPPARQTKHASATEKEHALERLMGTLPALPSSKST